MKQLSLQEKQEFARLRKQGVPFSKAVSTVTLKSFRGQLGEQDTRITGADVISDIEQGTDFVLPSLKDVSRGLTETGDDIIETGKGIFSSLKDRAVNIKDAFGRSNRGEQTNLETGAQLAGNTVGAVFDTGFELAKGAVKSTFTQANEDAVANAVKSGIQKVADTKNPFNSLVGNYGDTDTLGEQLGGFIDGLSDRQKANLDAGMNIAEVLTLGGATPALRVGKDIVDTAIDLTTEGVKNFSKNFNTKKVDFSNPIERQVFEEVVNEPEFKIETKQGMDNVVDYSNSLRERIQKQVGSKNVQPQIETSFRRFLDGTENRGDALGLYDEYIPLAKKAVKDIYADPPISKIGNEMGNEFMKVVQQRRDVGKIMGEELNNVRTSTTDISNSSAAFRDLLEEQGMGLNNLTGELRVLDNIQGTSLADSDIKLLKGFAQELQALGSNPTVLQLDNTIRRVQANTDIGKQTSGITKTTNGERIMIATLTDMVDRLKQTPGLAKYAEARETYSSLSNFIKEGEKHLGKLTQSGDFTRDASILKSSVQSVLNNGKKDWLLKLEGLTGYPALDKSVIALQAMKDAGDARGLSLLEKVADSSLPTSQGQILDRVVDYAYRKATSAIVGSEEEATRAFLKSIVDETERIYPKP